MTFVLQQALAELNTLLTSSTCVYLVGPPGAGRSTLLQRLVDNRADTAFCTDVSNPLPAPDQTLIFEQVTPANLDAVLATPAARRVIAPVSGAPAHGARMLLPGAQPVAAAVTLLRQLLHEQGISQEPDSEAEPELTPRGNQESTPEQTIRRVIKAVRGNPLALQVVARRARWMGIPRLARELEQDSTAVLFAADEPHPSPLATSCERRWTALSTSARRVCLALAMLPAGGTLDRLRSTLDPPEHAIQELDDNGLLRIDARTLGLDPVFAAWSRFASSDDAVKDMRASVDRWLQLTLRDLARSQTVRGDDESLRTLEQLVPELELRLQTNTGSPALRLAIWNGLSCYYRVRSEAFSYQTKLRQNLLALAGETTIPREDRLIAACELARWGGRGEGLQESRSALRAIEPELQTKEEQAIWASARADLATAEQQFDASDEWRAQALAMAEALNDPLWRSRELINTGVARYWQDRTDEALELFGKAEWNATRHGARRIAAIAAGNLALITGRRGDVEPAIQHGQRSFEVFESLQDKRAAANALMHLGIFLLNADRLQEARSSLQGAAQRLQSTQDGFQEALVRENLADVLLELGALDDCRHALQQSRYVNGLSDSPSPHIEAHNRMLTGLLAAREGSVERAREILGALTRGTGRGLQYFVEGRFYLAVLGLQHSDVELARRALAGVEGALEELAEPMHHNIFALLNRLSTRAETDEDGLIPLLVPFLIKTGTGRYHNVLLVRRVLDGLDAHFPLDVRCQALMAASGTSPPLLGVDDGRQVAIVEPTGSSDAAERGTTVDLSSRSLLWSLLNALAGAPRREHQPDQRRSLSVEQLTEALWPGERIQADAAANRVYNAVALLRRRGLASVLDKDDDGYRLVNGTAVVRLQPGRWSFQQQGASPTGTWEDP